MYRKASELASVLRSIGGQSTVRLVFANQPSTLSAMALPFATPSEQLTINCAPFNSTMIDSLFLLLVALFSSFHLRSYIR